MFMNVFNTIEFSPHQVASPAIISGTTGMLLSIGVPGHAYIYMKSEILREAYSYPAVEGIIMFVGPAQAGFINTQLADANFKNTQPETLWTSLLVSGELELIQPYQTIEES
ncbi:glycosyl hydrolase superfamily protein, putative [Medicago truncatula]|uniref:Glycosyl hydrolase superfamily protein, putative n=1 Tax=Medicago truncatula TaxID=3880 RepID=A0A072TE50_MEDTR|nr:glycosyl hydrolase superfamily protein, putative [Medicago truncatula]